MQKVNILKIVLLLSLLPLSLFSLDFSSCKHLLNRTSLGLEKTQLESCLQAESYDTYVHTLIYKNDVNSSTAITEFPIDFIRPSRKMRDLNATEKKVFRKKRRQSYMALKQWWFKQMLTTDDPFREKMLLFWHNHFTSSLRKVGQAALIYNQHMLFRAHAVGNFATLLHAIVEDPAMLIYLDNRANRKNHPNENLARELLELFTLGEGHYSENDIQELARALTGYTLNKKLQFNFRKKLHDKGKKTFMGKTGKFNAHDMIDIILEQPETATYLVEKLWRTFIGESPDPKEVTRLAALFRENHYEMKPLLEALFTSSYFTNSANYGNMIKSPVELIAGTLRSFHYKDFDAKLAVQFTRRLGQNLFDPPNVKGWKGGYSWVNTHTLLIRKGFLNRLLRGDSMTHLDYALFDTCTPQISTEACAAKVLLPVSIFMTPAHTFKQTLRNILQQPLYQLK